MSQAREIELSYAIVPEVEAWALPEGDFSVPQSRFHDLLTRYLVDVFEPRLVSRGVMVAHDLAIRWIEKSPRVGVDPDVCIVDPAPPEGDALRSLCLWKPGHVVPRLAVEVVSSIHPYKDYVSVQDKYAACGVPELWVLDPTLLGPRRFGGPFPLQVWRRNGDAFCRVYAGTGPYRSPALDVWVQVVDRDVVVSDDEAGEQRWLTADEAARADANAARADADAARADADAARADADAARAAQRELEARLQALETKR